MVGKGNPLYFGALVEFQGQTGRILACGENPSVVIYNQKKSSFEKRTIPADDLRVIPTWPAGRTEMVRAIVEANEDDYGPSLVYADWLEEVLGDSVRAQYIRLSCPPLSLSESNAELTKHIWIKHRLAWLVDEASDFFGDRLWKFGCISRVEATSKKWLLEGPSAARKSPLREVILEDKFPRLSDGFYVWETPSTPTSEEHRLPTEICYYANINMRYFNYPERALQALSLDCLRWARSK